MFHEVRVLDANGKLKKTISKDELSKAFWNKIFAEEESGNVMGKKVPSLNIRKRLKEMYPHLYDLTPNFNF